MRALVTGGGGFLGRYVVEELLRRGNDVRVLARKNYPQLASTGIEMVQGDVRDAGSVRTAAAGCEAVFHVAAVPGIWGSWRTYYEINTLGTEHVIAACRTQGVRRLVYTSSPSVVYDGAPHLDADELLPYPQNYLCHYPRSKALAEQAVLAADSPGQLRTTSLRPHLIWGPRDNHLIPRLIARARQGRLVRIGDGTNLISMSYVENAAAGHLQADEELAGAARCAGRAYFINEPEPVRLWDWVDQLLALAELPPVKRRISARSAHLAGLLMEGIYSLLPLQGEPPMTRFLASQLSQSHTYSIRRAAEDFGYAPRIGFDEGMQRLRRSL